MNRKNILTILSVLTVSSLSWLALNTLVKTSSYTFKTLSENLDTIPLNLKSEEDKFKFLWPNFYEYLKFVQNYASKESVIMHPPQISPWDAEGNQFLVRGFLYPSKLKVGRLENVKNSDFVFISAGFSNIENEKKFGWPYFPVPFKEIYSYKDIREVEIKELTINDKPYDNWLSISQIDLQGESTILNLDKKNKKFSFSYKTVYQNYWGWGEKISKNSSLSITLKASSPSSVSLFVCLIGNNDKKVCLESSPNQKFNEPEKLVLSDINDRLLKLGLNPNQHTVTDIGLNFGYLKDRLYHYHYGLIEVYKPQEIEICNKSAENTVYELYQQYFDCITREKYETAKIILSRLNLISPDRYWYSQLNESLSKDVKFDTWQSYLTAKKMFNEGQTDIALKEVNNSLALHPQNFDSWFLKGLISEKLGNNLMAAESFRFSAQGYDPTIEITPNWKKRQEYELLIRKQIKVLEANNKKKQNSEELISLYKSIGDQFQANASQKALDNQLKRLSFELDYRLLPPEILTTTPVVLPYGQTKGEFMLEDDKGILKLKTNENFFHFSLPPKSTAKPLDVNFNLRLYDHNYEEFPIFCLSPIGGNFLTIEYKDGRLVSTYRTNTRFFSKARSKEYINTSDEIKISNNSWHKIRIFLDKGIEVYIDDQKLLSISKHPIKLNRRHVYNLINCPGVTTNMPNPISISNLVVNYK